MLPQIGVFRRLGRKTARVAALTLLLAAMSILPTAVNTEPALANGTAYIYVNRDGFDTCTSMSTTLLHDWYNSTPWFVIGMYLGGTVGQNIGCYDGYNYINSAISVGYGVVPYWFGPQLGGNCAMQPYSSYISLNTTTAYNQGVSEADSAGLAAISGNFPYNAFIYYDMEAYYANSGCRAAAKAFMNGWVFEMAYGTTDTPGGYGSSCASYVDDWATNPHVPYAIAPATGTDVANVFNAPCIPSSHWSGNQRVSQFSPGDYGVYNGYGMNVDEECADAYLIANASLSASSCHDAL